MRRLALALAALLFAVLPGLTFVPTPAAAFDARPALPAPAAAIPAYGTVEILFSPEDDVEAAILRLLRAARRTVHVQAFLLTSRAMAAALIDAQARGVRVEVLADGGQAARLDNSRLGELAQAGIAVALEVRYAAAHNKIILVDAGQEGGSVLTGSYNFTWSAHVRNAENVVILRGNPAVQRTYLDYWQQHRREAVPFAEFFKRP